MADNVQWIKFKVGTFDGMSFKRIKKAKIEGVADFRDKLTAVWFELLDLAGKINNEGFLINDEIAFSSYEEIAIALDRSEQEIKLCIEWYKANNMIDIVDDVLLISNWSKYQNSEGLNKIRETNRLRQQRFREKQKQVLLETKDVNDDNVTVTLRNGFPLRDNTSSSLVSKSSISNSFKRPSLDEVTEYCNERNNDVDAENFINFYESKGWMIGKNKMKSWKAAVRTWEKSSTKPSGFKTKNQMINDEKDDQLKDIAKERGYVK